MKYLIALVVLAACGKGTVPQAAVQDGFRDHVEAFILAGRDRGVDVSVAASAIEIAFGTPQPGAIAECRAAALVVGRRIVVSEEIWQHVDVARRRALILHELGHCVLNLKHSARVPAIMNPSSVSGETLTSDTDGHLLDVLFGVAQ